MSITLGVVMDPITSINPHKDTSLAMLVAAQKRGWNLIYMEMDDLYLLQGQARASTRKLRVSEHTQTNDDHWFELGEPSDLDLGDIDVILMRKDPPFDSEFVYSTYILEAAERQGALVVNRPQSLRDCNEKVFATQFPNCCPPVLVSRNMQRLRDFHNEHGDVIFKPLDGMGGTKIFRCRPDDPNLGVILETLTQHGQETTMAQKFIPAISRGDKRVLVVAGKAIPYSLARIPAEGETRGNLAAGGHGVAQPLSERDQWIADQIAPTLLKKGLLFVGLDIIGDYLTEINVTSPTCVQEIDRAYNTDIAGVLMDAIDKQLQTR